MPASRPYPQRKPSVVCARVRMQEKPADHSSAADLTRNTVVVERHVMTTKQTNVVQRGQLFSATQNTTARCRKMLKPGIR